MPSDSLRPGCTGAAVASTLVIRRNVGPSLFWRTVVFILLVGLFAEAGRGDRFGSWMRPSVVLVAPSLLLLLMRRGWIEMYLNNVSCAVIATVTAINVLNAVAGNTHFYVTESTGPYVSVEGGALMGLTALTGYALCRDSGIRRWFLNALWACGFGVASSILLFSSAHRRWVGQSAVSQALGVGRDPNIVLLFVIPPLLIAAGAEVTGRPNRYLLWLAGLVGLAATVATASRMGIIVILILVLGSLLHVRFRVQPALKWAVAFGCLLGVVFLCSERARDFVVNSAAAIELRFQANNNGRGALDDRLAWWGTVSRQDPISIDRLWGSGWEGATYPHNAFADAYLIAGVPGLCGFLSLYWLAFRPGRTRTKSPRGRQGWSQFPVILAVLSCAMMCSALSLLNTKLLWLLLGAGIGCTDEARLAPLHPRSAGYSIRCKGCR